MSLITALSCVSTASHVKSRETSISKMADSAGEKKLAEEKKGEEPIEPEEQPMEIDSATEKDETGPKAGGGDVKPEPDKVEAPSVDVKKDEPDVSLENKKESGGESDTTQSIDKIEKPETADSQNSQATEVEAAKDPTETISKKIASSSESEKGDNVVKPEVQDKGVIAPEEPKPVGANEKVPEIDTKSGTKEKAQSEESMQIDGESPDTNSEHCYCGKDRNLGSIELQCAVCLCWYHNGCINCYIGTCMPFMTNYQFGCKRCNVSKIESFTRKTATFSHMCLTAMANLTHQKPNTVMFSKDKDIIPYIDKHWENLTSMPRRVKLTWHNTVLKTMTKESEIFVSKEDTNGDYLFALLNPDLTRVGPGLEALKAVALASRNSDIKTPPSFEPKTGRSTKRRFPVDYQQLQGSRLKRSEMGVATKMAPHGYPLEHPFNKDGYRYILAESDPHAPNRQAFDESLDWAGKPIPGYLYRTFLGSAVLLALHDRAPQLKISDSRLTVIGDKGYSMIRATHGVRYGSWYFEVTIDDMPAESATRIGWSQPLGNLQAPCGYDKFSYSWRSCKGTRFHQSRGKHYTEEGYGTGDVLGFYVHLPQPEDPHKLLPPDYKDKPLVKFKSHLYYEEKDYVSETEKNLKPVPGSKIIAFKNGKAQPVAYEGIYEGVYYPAISLYKNATVSMNFGPTFKFPPKDLKDFRPMSEAATQAIIDHCLSDVIYHVENEGKQPEF